jgi:hypothetical protein
MTWQDDALCAGNGNRWLSMPTHSHPRGAVNEWAVARCHDCPVLADCRRWVLSHDQDPCPYHVVAGMTISERRAEARRRARLEVVA